MNLYTFYKQQDSTNSGPLALVTILLSPEHKQLLPGVQVPNGEPKTFAGQVTQNGDTVVVVIGGEGVVASSEADGGWKDGPPARTVIITDIS